MNWEQTIKYIRTRPEFKELIAAAYFEENLPLNVERFKAGDEFKETLAIVKNYLPNCKKILDVGSGNGISSIAFALSGYEVLAVEPDPSETIGAGAIRKLREFYKLNNVEVLETFAEELKLQASSFDLVYARQCMHHAYDLEKFIAELSRVLKPGGILLTVRDHVVFDKKDKKLFLETHPLHKFYGGENAFSPDEYKNAIKKAGLIVRKEIKYFESEINYFPLTKEEIKNWPSAIKKNLYHSLKNRIGFLAKVPFIFSLYKWGEGIRKGSNYNERLVPGRMYTYIAQREE